MEAYAVPLAALIISVATLVYNAMVLRGKTERSDHDFMRSEMQRLKDDLREQARDYQRRIDECERRCNELVKERLALMQRLIEVTGKGA